MERTKYFNQTKPTDTQLNWTETSRAHSIIERTRAGDQFGVVEGFQVTVNGTDPTKIDIAGGSAYSGGMYTTQEFDGENAGERISTSTFSPSGTIEYGTAATGVGLADYTNGNDNYVSLVYAESEGYPLAERSYPFTNHNTVVTETYSVSVLAEADWNALTAAQKNQRVLIAIITANGAGTALTSASISQFTQPKQHPSSSQPSTITGVSILTTSDTTPIGDGTLRFEVSTSKLYWTAPGDAEGTGVAIPSSGDYTLYSDSTSFYIDVEVIFANLPAADTSETIYIQSLYGRTFPIFSAKDVAHRDMVGSGSPTPSNPHGLTLSDISEGTFDHADLFHVNGISTDADSNQLECSIDAINERVLVNNVGSFRNSFLIDGITYQSLTGVSAGSSGTSEFNVVPLPTSGEYLIYVDSAGEVQRVQIGNALWDTNIYIVDMENTTAGVGTITWDNAAKTLTYEAPGDGVAGTPVRVMDNDVAGGTINGYYKLYSSVTDNWVIVYCSGSLGVGNSSNITIEKNATDNADESILKLCVVEWDGANVTNLRDIRRFLTADTAPVLLEEHDENGQHTKVLQNQLRVGCDSFGLYASVDDSVGVCGIAATETGVYGRAFDSYGVYGHANTQWGVYGYAPNTAIYGSAKSATGVMGEAATYGVYGTATASLGVYGIAPNKAVFGVAATASGVVGSASSYGVVGLGTGGNIGGYMSASSVGLYAKASTYAVSALAEGNGVAVAGKTAVFGTAENAGANPGSYGVYGKAGRYGVMGLADSYGVGGEADKYGVYGKADNAAVYGIANVDTAVYGYATGDTGGYLIAGDSYGVYGKADTYGVYGSAAVRAVAATASNEAGYFLAAGGYIGGDVIGVFGRGQNLITGNSAIGIFGNVLSASATAVYGSATAVGATGVMGEITTGTNARGVYGIATNDACIGVYGSGGYRGVHGGLSGTSGVGVYGTGSGATATGVYGRASNAAGIGVAGSGESLGMYCMNTFVYSVGTVGGALTSRGYVPVIIGGPGGATYYIMIYS